MKAYKRYNPQSSSSSSSGLLLETIVIPDNDDNDDNDNEIVGILNNMKYISSDSPYIKDDRKIYNDTYTDNDDSTVNTVNSYHSNYSSHYRDANPNRYKAIHYMRKGDYRVALQLFDTIDDDYDNDYKLLCYRSICYSHLKHHDKAYDMAVQCINIISDQDKYPNVTILLQLAKCQYNKKLYKDAIITLLKAHQENERSFIDSDSNNAGNYRVKINDMIRKTKTEMRIDQEKNDPAIKYSLPIIEYSKKHSSRIGNGNSNNSSPITVGSSLQSSLGSSPNTTISSISYDSQDSFQETSRPKLSSQNKNDNKNNKNTKKKKTKVILPLIQPKIKSQFPKYKKGTTLRAVIELEKERKQELFRMNNKKSENISYFVNLLGTLS